MVIAVTGATGHSGRYFIDQLIAHNYSDPVRFLIRKSTDTQYIQDSGLDAEFCEVDLNDIQALQDAFASVDVVLHIANIHFSLAVVQAAIGAGVGRVVLVHTTGIYSKFKMASQEYLEIEAAVEGFAQQIEIVTLRPTMIFGDICDHNISKFIKMVDKLPVMPMIGKGTVLIQPVNARDLGLAYYTAVTCQDIAAESYILSGSHPISMVELFRLIGKGLNKKCIFLCVPLQLGLFAAKLLKVITFGKINYNERVLRMTEDRSYSHHLAKEKFGYVPECFEIGLQREIMQYLEMRHGSQ